MTLKRALLAALAGLAGRLVWSGWTCRYITNVMSDFDKFLVRCTTGVNGLYIL